MLDKFPEMWYNKGTKNGGQDNDRICFNGISNTCSFRGSSHYPQNPKCKIKSANEKRERYSQCKNNRPP